MAQEAAINAIKHRKSTDIRIILEEVKGRIGLTIVDNGARMDETAARKVRSGMRIIRYRAAAIGADLRIDSAQGQGTRIKCRVSVAEDRYSSEPLQVEGA